MQLVLKVRTIQALYELWYIVFKFKRTYRTANLKVRTIRASHLRSQNSNIILVFVLAILVHNYLIIIIHNGREIAASTFYNAIKNHNFKISILD